MQENEFSTNEKSFLGRIKASNEEIEWSVKKQDIDLAHKNKMFDSELAVNNENFIFYYNLT